MTVPRRTAALLLALVAGTFALGLALLGWNRAEAQNVPVAASPNVELRTVIPGTAAISGVFSRSAPYFYVSGLDSLTVIDVKDPKKPQMVGKLANALFENEAMTLGERVEDGKIKRFVLIGNDLVQANAGPGGIQRGRLGGGELIVADVTTPTDPKIVGRTPGTGPGAATTSTHTVACMDAACRTAYSAGDTGKFSVFDLTDLTKPKQIAEIASPSAGPNPVFTTGSGHHWQVDGSGVAWHTGSGGATGFDITDPRAPKPLTGSNEQSLQSPYNDFIFHNAQRPNGRAFSAGRQATVTNGNVLLVTEEDYANPDPEAGEGGDEVVCERSGIFQTWEVKDLDGEKFRATNPKNLPGKGTMTPLDTIHPAVESGGGLSAPAGAFCSAHWFDFHQSGVVAQGFYQTGLRLIDVRNPKDLKQFGYFTGGATEVWDAYWAPQRDGSGAVVPGKKTNLVYTVDAVQGVGVYEVTNLPPDLPVSGDDGGRGAFPSDPTTVGQAAAASGGAGTDSSSPGTGSGSGASAPGAKCGAPTSRFAKGGVKLTRKRITLKGVAKGAGCGIAKVEVAIGRKIGKQCRWLQADGSFSAKRSCLRTSYLRATGTESWRLSRKASLPRGRYDLWSRATDAAGTVERKFNKRNLARTSVRR